ncbi:hypothetical protein JCM30760_26090 [Thiomicrorhabdus hydrogeniphila]
MEVLVIILAFWFGTEMGDGHIGSPAVTDSYFDFETGSDDFTSTRNNYVIKKDNLKKQYIVFKEDGYVVSDKDLIPTKKTKYIAPSSKDINEEVHVSTNQTTNFVDGEGRDNNVTKPGSNSQFHDSSYCDKKFYKVYFDHNKYNLKTDALKIISAAVKNAKECKITNIVLRGHATIDGGLNHNIQLATNRANSVKRRIEEISGLDIKVMNPLSAKGTFRPQRYVSITLSPRQE